MITERTTKWPTNIKWNKAKQGINRCTSAGYYEGGLPREDECINLTRTSVSLRFACVSTRTASTRGTPKQSNSVRVINASWSIEMGREVIVLAAEVLQSCRHSLGLGRLLTTRGGSFAALARPATASIICIDDCHDAESNEHRGRSLSRSCTGASGFKNKQNIFWILWSGKYFFR